MTPTAHPSTRFNAADEQRFADLVARARAALEAGSAVVTLTIRRDRQGHVCRRESAVKAEWFPLDDRPVNVADSAQP